MGGGNGSYTDADNSLVDAGRLRLNLGSANLVPHRLAGTFEWSGGGVAETRNRAVSNRGVSAVSGPTRMERIGRHTNQGEFFNHW